MGMAMTTVSIELHLERNRACTEGWLGHTMTQMLHLRYRCLDSQAPRWGAEEDKYVRLRDTRLRRGTCPSDRLEAGRWERVRAERIRVG